MQMWKKTSRWHATEKKRAARGAHEEFPKKTLRDKERTKKKKKRQEEEEEETAASGAHGQVMEEIFAVAQKEKKRATRDAHEELPKKT